MGLRIVSGQLQSGEKNPPNDEYFDRIRKYIPTEVVSFWLAVSGMIQSAGEGIPKITLLWVFFTISLLFTFGWTIRRTTEPKKRIARTQISISCVSFMVWVFATGGPLAASLPFYQPLYGSLLLITYTAAVGFIIPPEE
jgi:hypothetical protein